MMEDEEGFADSLNEKEINIPEKKTKNVKLATGIIILFLVL